MNSVIQQASGDHAYTSDPTNVATDPKVVEPWVLSVSFATWRQNAAFVDANVVAVEAPPDLMGDYHLQACTGAASSPACDLGASSRGGVNAPDLGHRRRHPALGRRLRQRRGRARRGGRGTHRGLPVLHRGQLEPAGSLRDARTTRTSTGGTAPAYTRAIDVSTAASGSVPPGANVDGFAQQDASTFYLSFSNDTTLPGLGAVQDEDVVKWDGSAWSVFFDGTAKGFVNKELDVDAISVRAGVLYFATAGAKNPPGVTGTADDADIYSWNGTSFARVFDASANGVPDQGGGRRRRWIDATHLLPVLRRGHDPAGGRAGPGRGHRRSSRRARGRPGSTGRPTG